METSEKIIKYIKDKGQATGSELSDYLGITGRAVRKQLANLLGKHILRKVGRPPKVFYLLKEKDNQEEVSIDKKTLELLDDNYLVITPTGEKKDGFDGFVFWCRRNNLDIKKTAKEYVKTIAKYNKYKKSGFINGLDKMKETFKDVYLDKLYYLDFYSIERFGKTKLGQLLLYGKQSGNKKIIKEIVENVKSNILKLIKKNNIDAVGFVPWSVKREVQFMKELEKKLDINLKSIGIEKVKTEIIVPQKSLSKLRDRVENTENTMIVREGSKFNRLLLIDDAVGSGATLNGIGKKIKDQGVAKEVIGLALTGSFKGFDVISEV